MKKEEYNAIRKKFEGVPGLELVPYQSADGKEWVVAVRVGADSDRRPFDLIEDANELKARLIAYRYGVEAGKILGLASAEDERQFSFHVLPTNYATNLDDLFRNRQERAALEAINNLCERLEKDFERLFAPVVIAHPNLHGYTLLGDDEVDALVDAEKAQNSRTFLGTLSGRDFGIYPTLHALKGAVQVFIEDLSTID